MAASHHREQIRAAQRTSAEPRVRWSTRIVLTALMASALILGGGARAEALFRCSMMERVSVSCCCPTARVSTQSPVFDRAACCERVEGAAAPASGSLRSGAWDIEHIQALVGVLAPSFASAAPRWHARACPATASVASSSLKARAGPRLLLLLQRFLL
jgi:hypothetical protein